MHKYVSYLHQYVKISNRLVTRVGWPLRAKGKCSLGVGAGIGIGIDFINSSRFSDTVLAIGPNAFVIRIFDSDTDSDPDADSPALFDRSFRFRSQPRTFRLATPTESLPVNAI